MSAEPETLAAPPASPAPAPAEVQGLRGARLAARVRQALYRTPPAALAEGFRRMREGGTARHLDYFSDGVVQTIRVFPCPITILPDEIEYVHRVVRTIHDALVRLPELYLADPAVRGILRLEPEEEEWLRDCWRPGDRIRNPVFGRLDALVDYSSPVWKDTFKFVEPNLTGIGGLHLIPSVEEIVAETIVPLLAAQDPGLRVERLTDARELLHEELTAQLDAVGRAGGTVCFVEPKYEMEGIDEQRRLVEYLHDRHGMTTVHADPSELRAQDGEVYYEDVRVDLVYRDYSVLDLIELEREGTDVTPMRTLFRENRVVSSIGAELDHKACWELLTDPEIAGRHFDEASRRCFQRHVLWTRVLAERGTTLPDGETGDLLPFARRARETLVLKPSRGYGGDGVVIGQTLSTAEWDQALDDALADPELWVVQSLAHIPVLEVPTISEDGSLQPEMYYHVMGYASGPGGLAILARASQRQVVNVAQRGGMTAVMRVDEVGG
ncbi:MAG TPA: hypothetical protein VFN08_13475 [Gemmatimonadales bacterium]|jgi:hypothetical protein|nr:hypothetical protein [Gemmatimonadales bacterium]